ncbi:MAG TPA: oxaloacetate decarboxylase subunit alpha [Thermoanaerobacterales bacterium]|nr:oxaloacetate decarboxylase subunit alpha [Thermoanaerobacterales bacterium]
MGKIKITDTILRDAHQSLLATRMAFDEMEPVLEMLDKVGYFSLEVWGGATFDACLRFLDEDPWERLRKIREKVKNTKLQMLLRGQNLLGYKHYPDDVVDMFVSKSIENGIDVIRIFDALNDVRNMEVPIRTAKREGAHVQGTVVYTISPAHNIEGFVQIAKKLVDLGADSICIKDMAGILAPFYAYELIKRMKQDIDIPIQIHTHYTSGMSSMTCLKAIEAGADIVDTAISSLALGTSQPPTESIVVSLKDTPYDTELDLTLLADIAQHFRHIVNKYKINRNLLGVDTRVINYQIPGGMLSNLTSQLEQQNALDKFEEVLKEVPKVREELGYPPLVTPTSQIVGTQAVLNVLTGERYKMVPNEVKQYVKGYYGKPTIPIEDNIRKIIIGNEKPITCRPADLIEPQLKKLRSEAAIYIESDEDLLSYALFPQVATDYFKRRLTKRTKVDPNLLVDENSSFSTYPV